ncbi:hypothetical protein QLX08_000937 [Tetragonisca angustula]|uniref:Uncharacterized protein n=1 Tax=Tetragonisca angustula TaxID=166442 RepID=A0AAW1AH96_9HYME
MARIKKHPHARSHHKMKLRRKPDISELVYKFLSLGGSKEDAREALRNYNITKCQFCKRLKRREEVVDCPNSRPGGSMANKRKDTTRNSKVRRVKRRQTSRDQTLSSCMHKSSGGEGIKKMKRYIQKALDFGVESGYLIPKDAAYKVLRVSSDLMNDVNYASKDRRSDGVVSQVRGRSPRRTPIRFEDYEVQDARRRRRGRRRGRRRRRRSRRGRRRSRSRSKRGRRRRSRGGRKRDASGAEEEVVDIENEDEYDFGKQGEQRKSPEAATRSGENDHLNQSNSEKKKEDDASDLSMDEEETDDEEEKKREETTKS